MNINKATSRDKKRNKRINGMRIDGKSLFVIQKVQKDKADKNSPNCRAR